MAPQPRVDPVCAEGAPATPSASLGLDKVPNVEPVPRAPIPDQPLFTNLEVDGFPPAVVSLPNGAVSPRPLIIVLHGSADRPDWNCDAWRHITGATGFVLCPRGDFARREPIGDDVRYTLRGGSTLQTHIQRAVSALAARFVGYVDVSRPVVTGFSLGAAEATQLALDDPARFSRVALLEGGHGGWTGASVKKYATLGGGRVLFGCGTLSCASQAKANVSLLVREGVDARSVYANVGHSNDRPLQEAIMADLAWFLQGDSRWAHQR